MKSPLFAWVFVLHGLNALAWSAEPTSTAIDAKALLAESDLSRGGGVAGVTWNLKVTNIEQKLEKNTIQLKVEGATVDDKILGLITFLAPDKYRGQKLLIRDYNLWFGKPGLRHPVPISGRQRLTGSAANADVAASNYAHDYEAKVNGEDSVAGEKCYVLDLTAKASQVTYGKLRYWVSVSKHLGLKCEFFGVSGKLIKSATFEYKNEIKANGKAIPFISRIDIRDAINREDATYLDFSEVKLENHNLNKFQQKNMIE